MLNNVTIPNATITNQNIEGNSITISYIRPEGGFEDTVVLNLSTTTFIHHQLNRRMYRIDDLTVGTKISVVHSPMMTFSLPPQTSAVEVIILQNQN
ncbi:MAG: hypothetical protein ACRCSG_07020 [Cellulosilyticaceae bacterium]